MPSLVAHTSLSLPSHTVDKNNRPPIAPKPRQGGVKAQMTGANGASSVQLDNSLSIATNAHIKSDNSNIQHKFKEVSIVDTGSCNESKSKLSINEQISSLDNKVDMWSQYIKSTVPEIADGIIEKYEQKCESAQLSGTSELDAKQNLCKDLENFYISIPKTRFDKTDPIDDLLEANIKSVEIAFPAKGKSIIYNLKCEFESDKDKMSKLDAMTKFNDALVSLLNTKKNIPETKIESSRFDKIDAANERIKVLSNQLLKDYPKSSVASLEKLDATYLKAIKNKVPELQARLAYEAALQDLVAYYSNESGEIKRAESEIIFSENWLKQNGEGKKVDKFNKDYSNNKNLLEATQILLADLKLAMSIKSRSSEKVASSDTVSVTKESELSNAKAKVEYYGKYLSENGHQDEVNDVIETNKKITNDPDNLMLLNAKSLEELFYASDNPLRSFPYPSLSSKSPSKSTFFTNDSILKKSPPLSPSKKTFSNLFKPTKNVKQDKINVIGKIESPTAGKEILVKSEILNKVLENTFSNFVATMRTLTNSSTNNLSEKLQDFREDRDKFSDLSRIVNMISLSSIREDVKGVCTNAVATSSIMNEMINKAQLASSALLKISQENIKSIRQQAEVINSIVDMQDYAIKNKEELITVIDSLTCPVMDADKGKNPI
ncbi:hypothetical protein ACVBEF_03320 [Glaciimonas sp. GG7]